ncbi:Na/Pi symporter [Thermosynechococcus sp. M55_K2018_012]|uniref:Na/Pi symporter n=1 Tax=Thermosynechococcus sp. M55_K2018_012 TaxID=2747809 RepID=UPI0019F33153|nr:Na/Pi symporter [Thermosynechococcus sp. M55_K2018_012]HIK48791.1 Na/Pi symporter [Thermosynechococcus sp. M55_K2018_012]
MDSSWTKAPKSRRKTFLQWLAILVLVYLLLVGIGVISRGFRTAVGDEAEQLFAFAENPFLGLVIGIVSTALVQSSSTTTSIIVGLVAGGLPVRIAIPMIMGANVGTSITNGIVSLGYVGNKQDFKQAFAASTVLDLFNLIAVLIFFPLELLFRPLERLSTASASLFLGDRDLSMDEFDLIGAMIRPVRDLIRSATGFLPEPYNGIFQIIIGSSLVLGSVYFIGKLLKKLMVGRAKDILHTTLGRGPIAGILAGIFLTILMQSSSATTSLMIPLAGSGVFGLNVIYPFTLGANIGTTVTSLLAATAVTGARALPALEIAKVHLFFNVLGVLLIFGIPFLRPLPVIGAERLGAAASENKLIALAYLVGVFFVIPLLLLGLSLLL